MEHHSSIKVVVLLTPTFAPPPRITSNMSLDLIEFHLRTKVPLHQRQHLREIRDRQIIAQTQAHQPSEGSSSSSDADAGLKLFGGDISVDVGGKDSLDVENDAWSNQVAYGTQKEQYARSEAQTRMIAHPPLAINPFAGASAGASGSSASGNDNKPVHQKENHNPFVKMFQQPAKPKLLANIIDRPTGSGGGGGGGGPPPEKKIRTTATATATATAKSSSSSILNHVERDETAAGASVGSKRGAVSKTGRQGARSSNQQTDLLTQQDFEGLQHVCRNAGKKAGLQSMVQSIISLKPSAGSSQINNKSCIGMTFVWRDLTSNHVTQAQKYCTPSIACNKWYCSCDRHLRLEQARCPILGMLFFLPDSSDEAHSNYTYFLPLAPCEKGEPEASSNYSNSFSDMPKLPLQTDLSTAERWDALFTILSSEAVYKIVYNLQLAMLPIVHHMGRLGRSTARFWNILDVRHAAYMLNSNAAQSDLELLNIIGSVGGSGSAATSPKAEQLQFGDGGGDSSSSSSSGRGGGGVGAGGKVARVFMTLHKQLERIMAVMSDQARAFANVSQNSFRAFCDVEMRLAVLLAVIENRGVIVNSESIQSLGEMIRGHLLGIDAQAAKIAAEANGSTVNLASPVQVSEMLFETLGLNHTNKTSQKGKHLSTNEADLQRIVHSHPIVQLVLDFRSLTKTLGTFIEGTKNHLRIDNDDDDDDADNVDDDMGGGVRRPVKESDLLVVTAAHRVHPHWHLETTRTGRLSCSKPNLQQYPKVENTSIKSLGVNFNIRSLFQPSPGKIVVAADYSQIEVRVLSHFCKDTRLSALLASNDLYRTMASLLFDKGSAEVSTDERNRAKVLTLATIYGLGSETMATDMNLPRSEALNIQKKFFAQFPGIRQWMTVSKDNARRTGYVTTLLSFKRDLSDLKSSDSNKRSAAERQCVNSIIQGSAADILKLAMLKVEDALSDPSRWPYGRGVCLLMSVHDELIYECPRENLAPFIALLRQIMERETPQCFVGLGALPVNILAGPDWGHLNEHAE